VFEQVVEVARGEAARVARGADDRDPPRRQHLREVRPGADRGANRRHCRP
jgi:hypothetical protein